MVSSLPTWSPCCRHGLLVADMVSSLPPWSPRCRHGLLIADMVSSLPTWSPCCRHGLLVADMVSSLPTWSPCCCHGLLIAAMVSLLPPWSPCSCHGLLIADMVSSLPPWSPHCRHGFLSAAMVSSLPPWFPLCRHGLLIAAMDSLLLSWSPHCRHGLLASVKGLPVAAGTSSLQSGSPRRRIVIHAAAISSAPSYRGRPHPRLSTAAVRHERTVHIRLFLLHNFPRTLLSVRTLSNRQMCATPCHWFSSSHLMVSTCGTLNPLRHSFAWYGLPQGGQANPLRKYADPLRLHLYSNSLVNTWSQSIAILMQPHASFSHASKDML